MSRDDVLDWKILSVSAVCLKNSHSRPTTIWPGTPRFILSSVIARLTFIVAGGWGHRLTSLTCCIYISDLLRHIFGSMRSHLHIYRLSSHGVIDAQSHHLLSRYCCREYTMNAASSSQGCLLVCSDRSPGQVCKFWSGFTFIGSRSEQPQLYIPSSSRGEPKIRQIFWSGKIGLCCLVNIWWVSWCLWMWWKYATFSSISSAPGSSWFNDALCFDWVSRTMYRLFRPLIPSLGYYTRCVSAEWLGSSSQEGNCLDTRGAIDELV